MFKKWSSLFKRKSNENYQTIQVCAPRDFFKRADVFIDDVKHMTKEELPGFNKAALVKLLFDNFLEKVREGEDLYNYVASLKKTYGSVLETPPDIVIKDMHRMNDTPKFSWKLPHKGSKREQHESLILTIQLRENEVNRVEVFFEDLSWRHHSLDLDLDELISLLFIEFISALRSGLTEETKEGIIEFILNRWEESA